MLKNLATESEALADLTQDRKTERKDALYRIFLKQEQAKCFLDLHLIAVPAFEV